MNSKVDSHGANQRRNTAALVDGVRAFLAELARGNLDVEAAGVDDDDRRLLQAVRDAWLDERRGQLKHLLEVLAASTSVRHQQRATAAELDVSERKLAHHRALAELGTLTTGIAHEITQPITAIALLSHGLLGEDDLDDADVREDIATIAEAAESLTMLAHTLRDFGNATAAERGPFEVNEVVERALRVVRAGGAAPTALECVTADAPLWAHGNGLRLEQVVRNLTRNGLDAGRRVVRVSVSATKDEVSIEVADDGAGVPSDAIDHIFEPFYSTKERGRGTGLGLALAKAIIDEHAGRLSYRREDAWSIFTATLPRIESP